MIPKYEKSFHMFVEHVEMNLLINNTLHFDQYSRLGISFNIFRVFGHYFETNLKKDFHLFVELVEINPLMHNMKDLR